jgi:hypothetical protein
MLETLANKYGQATSEIVRVVLAVAIAAVCIFGIVTIASDAGLGTEVTDNRVLIWTCAIALSLSFGLGHEVYSLASRLNERWAELEDVRSENEDLRENLQEAEEERDSVLRLMENYKRDAYDEVLNKLYLITEALDKKEEWIKENARVTQASIDIEDIEGSLSLPEKVNKFSNLNINIGDKSDVIEGMVFKVTDPSGTFDYGKILVEEVGEKGSRCKLIEGYNKSLWSEVRFSVNNGVSKVVSLKDNIIVPVIPEEIEDVEPDALQELRQAIEYASKFNR